MCLPPSAISPGTPVAWPPGAASTVTDLDGPVRHLDLGGPVDAPVVLCVHGLGGSALNWGLLAPLLPDSHRIDGHTAQPTEFGGISAHQQVTDGDLGTGTPEVCYLQTSGVRIS